MTGMNLISSTRHSGEENPETHRATEREEAGPDLWRGCP